MLIRGSLNWAHHCYTTRSPILCWLSSPGSEPRTRVRDTAKWLTDVCCISEFFRVVLYIAIAHAHFLPSHFFVILLNTFLQIPESDCNCFLHTISFPQLCFKNFIWFYITSSLNMLTLINLKTHEKLEACVTLIFLICLWHVVLLVRAIFFPCLYYDTQYIHCVGYLSMYL
jgi:vacuolar-type H+-ATPase subunit I/STV1